MAPTRLRSSRRAGTPHGAGRRAGDRHGRERRDDDLRASSRIARGASPARSASSGLGAGDHLAVLMENNRAVPRGALGRAALGAALHRRSTATSDPARCSTCSTTAAPPRSCRPRRWREVVGGLDLSPHRARGSASTATLDGFERYDDVLAAPSARSTPTTSRRAGRCSTPRAPPDDRRACARRCPGTPFGDPTAAPVQIAQGIGMFGGGPDAVYLSPAPLYHAAPLVYSMSMHRLGATVVVMERFDPEQCLAADRAPPRDPRPVRADDVRAHAAPPRGGARALRHLEPAGGRARRRAVPGADQAADDRVVGADHPRVLLGHRGHRRHVHHRRTSGSSTPARSGARRDECHIVGDDGTELPTGEVGVVYFAGGRPFEYHNDPEKTASIADEHGWRTLGDMGYLDDDGYLYLTDRKAHMIISGGVNIYPQEAENVLRRPPRRRRRRRHRRARPGDGRGGQGRRRAGRPGRCRPGARGRAARALPRAARRRTSARRSVDFVDELPAQRQRQALQAPAPRAVLGRPRLADRMTGPSVRR